MMAVSVNVLLFFTHLCVDRSIDRSIYLSIYLDYTYRHISV